jgi:dienelactone hydrolase
MIDVHETDLNITSADGWPLRGILRLPEDTTRAPFPVVMMVPDSFHERDAYESLAAKLHATGFASLRLDIRGRGASRSDLSYARMGPEQRRLVALDVGSALDHLAQLEKVASDRMAVVAERNTAPDVIAGAVERVGAAVVLGAWPSPRLTEALQRCPIPVLGLVSAEDRTGLRGTTDAFLAARPNGSDLVVLHGRGFGLTMFSTGSGRGSSLENTITRWLGDRFQ